MVPRHDLAAWLGAERELIILAPAPVRAAGQIFSAHPLWLSVAKKTSHRAHRDHGEIYKEERRALAPLTSAHEFFVAFLRHHSTSSLFFVLCLVPLCPAMASAVALSRLANTLLKRPAQALRAASPGRERNALYAFTLLRGACVLSVTRLYLVEKEIFRLVPRGWLVRAARGQVRLRTPGGSRCPGQGH